MHIFHKWTEWSGGFKATTRGIDEEGRFIGNTSKIIQEKKCKICNKKKTRKVNMKRIEKAIHLALEVHAGQTDLGGHPYILHPLRVLCAVERKTRYLDIKDRESVLCSAVLHDCIEDSEDDATIHVLIEKECGLTVVKTVDSLTRRKNETWKAYIDRLKIHWAPRFIKIADFNDNLDNSRLKSITEKDIKRNNMYKKTRDKLIKIEEENG